MCPSLTCSTVCHSNNSVTYYNLLASALDINSMQSLTPYIWPGSMHWLFMHSQKQRGWPCIKTVHIPTPSLGRPAGQHGVLTHVYLLTHPADTISLRSHDHETCLKQWRRRSHTDEISVRKGWNESLRRTAEEGECFVQDTGIQWYTRKSMWQSVIHPRDMFIWFQIHREHFIDCLQGFLMFLQAVKL